MCCVRWGSVALRMSCSYGSFCESVTISADDDAATVQTKLSALPGMGSESMKVAQA
jgi:hypothetical protein